MEAKKHLFEWSFKRRQQEDQEQAGENIDDLPKQPLKRVKQEEREFEVIILDDLPEQPIKREEKFGVNVDHLAGRTLKMRPKKKPEESRIRDDRIFEKVLSHLSLAERIKARAVSKNWRKMIDSFRPNSLCYSEFSVEFIFDRYRLVEGEFASNFICSSKFTQFFQTFGQSICSNLKKLRLCDLRVDLEDETALGVLEKFDQLEELDIIRFSGQLDEEGASDRATYVRLNLPMLKCIELGDVRTINRLTLDAHRLQSVRLWECPDEFKLEIVHAKPVRRLITDCKENMDLIGLKNLEHFYCSNPKFVIDSMLLRNLKNLKEVHLCNPMEAKKLFKQKQQYHHPNLMIYLWGVRLTDLEDPAFRSLSNKFDAKTFAYLLKNRSRLADKIYGSDPLDYSAIESAKSASDVLNRLDDLNEIIVLKPVRNVDRFLDVLRDYNQIVALGFGANGLQHLFDRLPGHCSAVQRLKIDCIVYDTTFITKLTSLNGLTLLNCGQPVELQFLEQLFNLPFFVWICYRQNDRKIFISRAKQAYSLFIGKNEMVAPDLETAYKLVIENAVSTVSSKKSKRKGKATDVPVSGFHL